MTIWENLDIVEDTLQEYLQAGAVRVLSKAEASRTQTWTPVFAIPKRDSPKYRVITDLRHVNSCCPAFHHKPQTWKSVVRTLQDRQLVWASKLDLKNWYHNLAVHPRTARWMRVKTPSQGYQIQAMPFGWNLSSLWSHNLAKPVMAALHQQGIILTWFVDDLLILGRTKQETESHTAQVINLLTRLGLKVNFQKSQLQPAQQVDYLGQRLDLLNNTISPLDQKRQATINALQCCLKGQKCPPG